jgi:Rad3-related DNA helicase
VNTTSIAEERSSAASEASTPAMSLTYTTFSLYLKRQTSMAVRGVDVLHEDRGLSQESVDRLVSEFSSENKPLVAVYNGRLGEGIDLSAGLVLLVGVPFSPPTARTTKLLRRLGEIVGDEDKARLYGVILPGLWSALQAAGRAIRGPEDSADTDAGAGNSRDNSQDAF